VCIDAEHVSSARVTLDGRTIAGPWDFDPHVVHLERQDDVVGGTGRLSGTIAGKPGSSLDVRVLADPARLQPQTAVDPKAANRDTAASGKGCASGPGGVASLLAIALLLARRRAGRVE
jgi:hypothetical protein